MRAGGCTVQQALTPEAAYIVKQAVNLARRRGHAQVTPLHVANAMLSSTTSLLRAACLQSKSHPLQCKALELCFNVALNRLPASSSSGPMLGPHHHHQPPSLSNALVAAFKRAQAHQRRGSIETQQQPLLAVKIELEQLIISILDDPSVSRVMREAGFSSTQVKSNVEQAVSLDVSSSPTSSNPNPNPNKPKDISSSTTITATTTTSSSSSSLLTASAVRSEDVGAVIQSLVSKRRTSVVIVGECLTITEGVVRGVMDRVEKEDVPETLRNLQFITLPLFSFANMCRDEVEKKMVELQCVVRACCAGRGVVLYLGDLKWAAEYREKSGRSTTSSYTYCPVEHVTMEIGRLVCGGINNINGVAGGHEGVAAPRFWLMGIATYQTYMKCRAGQLPLETLWGLQPLIVPAGSLGLSLNYDSCNSQNQQMMKSKKNGDAASFWTLVDDGAGDQLNCCTDYSVKFESTDSQSRSRSRSRANISSTSLPSWLQQYKEESKRSETTTTTTTNDQDCNNVQVFKWINSTSSSHKLHRQHPSEMTIHFASASLSSSSISSHGHHYGLQKNNHHHQIWSSEAMDECLELNSSSFPHASITIPNNPNSASSSDTMEMDQLPGKFKELNAENLKTLCNALEKKVSWQKGIIPDIASTILQCRSGMMRRDRSRMHKEETWLFFQGGDEEGKIRIARELASLVFGSSTNLVTISLSNFSSTRSGSSDDLRNKRSRSQESHSYLEKFFDSVRRNPHRVFLLEDIEQVDYNSQMGIKTAIETGKVQSSCGDDVCVSDAIVILSCVSFDSRSRACSPPVRHKSESEEEKDDDCEKDVVGSSICLDLNLCAGDEEDGGDSFLDDVGLLESVDRSCFFQLPEDL
ncbi:P-loop containing nucleoside triphosphate hydrolase protein [Dioscorea alata]|uniref:P-loop containing nucleoside triphosphate hydrolase protein n=1 Tax=Dioscorea alata TaxID=55571 RepID=A0ACB7VCL3_DIOAL|nr:P-loop containing nucleoside triphosphate hydrolase protein [Dioscorea alata]